MAPPPRRRIVGVSLKMYFTLSRTQSYISSILSSPTISGTSASNTASPPPEFFIIPDFLSLPSASALLSKSPIRLGAQDCFWEDQGAYTGEVSPASLAALGCSMVELGHAERRALFGETDEQVAKKARAAERNGLTPLVCVGERSRGSVDDAVAECWVQMAPVLEATKGEVVWAYEPVWAIGQAEPASAEYVVGVTKEIRRLCVQRDAEREVRVIYGGSAGPGTFEGMKEGVDGLFLGRFGHDVGNLERILLEIATP